MASRDPNPNRRQFLSGMGVVMGAAAMGGAGARPGPGANAALPRADSDGLLILSTWKFGRAANAAALAAMQGGATHPIDGCEAGVRVPEADPKITSVGYGGSPNADGVVQLDSCIMRGDTLGCGAVAGIEGVMHPVSVARRVMERTRHVLLVGEGAARFAADQGFPQQDMLTPERRARYEQWRAERREQDAAEQAEEAAALADEPWQQAERDTERDAEDRDPNEDHDTIGMIVMDQGRFGMAVTTSGLAWKLPGRVGDSPIVGAGGYCDDQAGAAVSTGIGEEVIRSCGSFAIVELMRQGASPRDACTEVLARIRHTVETLRPIDHQGAAQVSFIAVNRAGEVGAMSLRKGFQYARTDGAGTELIDGEVL